MPAGTTTTAPAVSTMAWNFDAVLLGTVFVDAAFSYTITPTWTASATDTRLLSSVSISVSSMPTEFVLTSTAIDCTISGPVSIAAFDKYSAVYVDQGSSDMLQTPITSTLANLPDFKELIKINIDNRTSIIVHVTCTATLDDGTTFTTINTLEIKQTYSMVNSFVKNYYLNRY